MIIIEVHGHQTCCATTQAVFYHPDLPKGTKLKDLGFDQSQFDNDREPDKLFKELKRLGFKQFQTQSVVYGGSY